MAIFCLMSVPEDPLISVAEAAAAVIARAHPFEGARVPLDRAAGRTLRETVVADADSPPFDASAMDGYACRRADLGGTLRVIGESAAGAPFAGPVGPGDCVRIFTGAPVPSGADWVVKQEDVARAGDQVTVRNPDQPDFIRRRGENRRRGDVVVAAGTRLGPPELAALAANGCDRPLVFRAPRCAHLVTGRELVPPGDVPAAGQIRDSNSILVAALLAREGAEVVGQRRGDDDLAAARTIADSFAAHDVLLISGGASVGDHDIAKPLLVALGYTLHFQAVNLRPGKPLVFATRGSQLAFALPGNPVSHWVVFHLFLAPLLRHWQGGANPLAARARARLAAHATPPAPDRRRTFWPCRAALVDGTMELTPLPLASSGDAAGLVGANALLPVPAPPATLTPGQIVDYLPCP